MTISSSGSTISYAGNGATTTFAFPYEYLVGADFVVTVVVEATSIVTTLVYGTDYTVNPSTNSPANTGSILTTVPVASGSTITITRVTPLTQETTWQINDAYPANFYRIENALDKLTNAIQETRDGSISDVALGTGTATYSTFLRGANATADDERVWSNTLIGSLGAAVLAADTTAVFTAQQSANASIRVGAAAGDQASYSFAVDGSANPWEMKWVYDDGLGKLGWQVFGGPILGTFDSSGIDVTGTVNANLFTGAADGSLITTGTIDPNRLGSGSPNSNKVLYGDSVWRIVSGGGGGINTTTTGTFTIAAVTSTQTVPVTSATGIVAGTYLQISDGTHTIIGHVTVVASLNLTFVTDSIVAGTAGNTMAGGAAVQSSTVPGNNTIFVEDGDSGSVAVQTLDFTGSNAGAVGNFVKLFIGNISGPVAQIEGYIDPAALSYNVFGTSGGGAGLVAYNSGSTSTLLHPTAANQVPICTLFAGSPITIGWGLIGPSNITSGSLTPVLLNATNSLTNGYVPSYDSGTGHFTWVANGGSIPGGGDAGKFFRGDNTFSQILDISLDSNPAGLLLAQGTANGNFGTALGTVIDGTQSYWVTNKKVTGTWTSMTGITTNYIVGDLLQHAVLSSQGPWFSIDGTFVENFYSPGIMRTGAGLRSVYGPLSKIYENDAPAASLTIDLANGAYQRLTNFVNNVTITLADTTPVPTLMSNAYESELTLEISRIQSTFSVDITWPGTITWVNGGSAPTVANGGLQATGFNIIRLIRVQNTGIANGGGARWFGFVENRQAGSGTVTSVATGTGLTGGPITTTGTISIPNLGITKALINLGAVGNAQFDGTDPLQASKIQNYSTHSGDSTYFLNNAGNWTQPSGGGGGGISPTNPNTWTATQTYTSGGHIVSSATNTFNAKNTFNGPQVFTSNGFGGTVGTNAVGQTSFNNYAFNDNVAPSLAAAQKTTLTNSFNGGSTQEILALSVFQTNKSVASGEGEGCTKVWNDIWKDITFGFGIGFQAITSARQVNGGNADCTWLNAWSPCAQFASTPDIDGITHSFGSGAVRIGECNYGNAWADLGFIDDRGGGHYVAGLEFFPAWVAGTVNATSFTQFPASWAIAIGAANGGPLGGPATNWTGILLSENSIVPGGLGVNMHGGNISTTTTGTFTIAAVGASQTVAVTAATNMSGVAGFQSALQITDGTHTILGHVTAGPPGLSLTFVTDFIIAGTAGNTMGTAAIVTAGPGVGINLQSQFTTGINFAGSAGGAPIGSGGGAVATFTSTGAAAITLADDQSIKFGSIWLRGHSSTLQYSTNGTSWSTLTLP